MKMLTLFCFVSGMQVMVCPQKTHKTNGRDFIHAPEPKLQDLGSQDIEADAPCILSTNDCKRMRDSKNNVTGRTVQMKGNAHGMCTFCLMRNNRQFPVDRSSNDYTPAFGFVLKNSPHMAEFRASLGLNDEENWIGCMEKRVQELYGEGVTSADLVQRLMEESTFLPYDLSYCHCEALSTLNVKTSEDSQDQPGAAVAQQIPPDSDGSSMCL
jgi:hypothetical protein